MPRWNVVCDYRKRQVLADCGRIDDACTDVLREHLVREHREPLRLSAGLGEIIRRYTFLTLSACAGVEGDLHALQRTAAADTAGLPVD